MTINAEEEEDEAFTIFKEPAGYFSPEKPATFQQYTMKSGQSLNLRLVGYNPLWGHHLWNGAKVIAVYIEENADKLVTNKTVLELGAGSGLPGLVCALLGAEVIVITDYPDSDLIDNLQHNIEYLGNVRRTASIHALGYLWGQPVDKLKSHLPKDVDQYHGFDLLILADLLFNHSEHIKLASTVAEALKRSKDAVALVFFTPYRPWLLKNDLNFFKVIEQFGLTSQKIMEQVLDRVMFDGDRGDELLRRTVIGYKIQWQQTQSI